MRQFVPTLDQPVCIISKIKIGDELFPFYVEFDIEVSVGQVIQFLGTLCTERKACIMWRLWLNCLFDLGFLKKS